MKTEKLLTAISRSAALLFREEDLDKAVARTLRNLGKAAGVSRVYIFENHRGPRGALYTSQRYEWVAPGITPQIDNPALQNIRASRYRLVTEHLRTKPFFGIVKDMRQPLKGLLESQQIRSIILVPIYVGKLWYGFVGFDDCLAPRRWSKAEISTLRIFADMLGGAIGRRREEERLRSILGDAIDSMETGLFIVAADFTVMWVNRAMERFFGIRRRDLMGADMRRFVRERMKRIVIEPEGFASRLLDSYRDGVCMERARCEVSPPGRRGSRTLRYWSRPVRRGMLAGGRIEFYLDVTEVEQASAALRASERKYRHLVEELSEGVSYADEDEVIRYANRSLCETLGYGPAGLAGRRIEEFLDERGKIILGEERRRRARGEHSRYELSMRARWGEMVPFEVSATPIFDEKGRFRGSYGVFTDIRERRKIETLKDELLRDASHELKAPTANIIMGLSLLKKHCPDDVSEECLLGFRMIEGGVERIQRNVESLTDLSAFEAGGVKLALRLFDLGSLLRRLCEGYAPRAAAKGLRLVGPPAKRILKIRADRDRLYHLFRNLIENSIRFSASGSIRFSARRGKGTIRVSVSDEGRGIEPFYLDRMFERHFQRYPSEPGTGVGLTLCRKIAELHGGRIWAESAGRGKGMTIHVALPRMSRSRKRAGRTSSSSGRRRVSRDR